MGVEGCDRKDMPPFGKAGANPPETKGKIKYGAAVSPRPSLNGTDFGDGLVMPANDNHVTLLGLIEITGRSGSGPPECRL
jgi:hypothetical protein